MVVDVAADLAPAAEDGELPAITADTDLVNDLGYHSLALLELAFIFETSWTCLRSTRKPVARSTPSGMSRRIWPRKWRRSPGCGIEGA
jgi:hypothetical protein